MAELLHLELVTPQKEFASKEVDMVVVPGADGDFAVMAHHAPLISMIRPGVIEVYVPGDEVLRYFVDGGYANISDNRCTVLAESLTLESELQKEEVQAELDALYEELGATETEHKRAAIQQRILETETKLFVAG